MARLVTTTVPKGLERIPGIHELAGLLQPNGRLWGEQAEDFQWADAAAFLGNDGPRYHYLSRPRGGAKSSDLAAFALVAMGSLPDDSRGYAVAADREQAARIIGMMWGYILRMEWTAYYGPARAYSVSLLDPRVEMRALASDSSSAYGLLPHLLIIDEIHQWPSTATARDVWDAIVTSAPKVAGCRMAVMSTAGDPAHWTRRIRDHAVADERWRAHEVPGPVPWIDPESLAEQERLLPPSVFARLHMNQWTESEDRLVSPGALEECVRLPGPSEPDVAHRYVIGLDVGLTHDRTACVVAHMDEGTIVVDLIRTWQGRPDAPVDLASVGAWLAEVGERYHRATLCYDPHEATSIIQGLGWRPSRMVPYRFSESSVGHLAMGLYGVLRGRQLALYPDAELLAEMADVRLRETSPNVYRIDHDPSKHDDRVIALALAVQHLLGAKPRRLLRSVA